MSFVKSGEVTELLLAWGDGDQAALHRLVPIVYDDLRSIAHGYMTRERPGHTLQTTALVHEAYERLVETPRVRWRDRTHFLAVCAQLMRRVLVDYARSKRCHKRGAGVSIAPLEEAEGLECERRRDLVAIDDALTELETFDHRKSMVVELRFFGGLTVEETAAFLKISPETVMRDWKAAKAWMLLHVTGSSPETSEYSAIAAAGGGHGS